MHELTLRWLAGISLAVVACGSAVQVLPEDRAVAVSTTACGDASKTTGSGVIIDAGRVLTVAHVVIGASDITVTGGDGEPRPATIGLLDDQRDLAILIVPGLTAAPVRFGELEPGDTATMVDGSSSGSVEAKVLRRLEMNVDVVRGTATSSRGGYELAAAIGGGDSGAGLFDEEGRLAGIVFAASSERDGIAWATRSDEIEAIAEPATDARYVCDAAASRMVLTEG